MKLFSRLFHDLDAMTKTNERVERLGLYFEQADPKDSIWACWFLAGNRIKGAVKTSQLRAFASERTGLPDWIVSESHERVGDLAETLSLLVEAKVSGTSLSLSQLVEAFIKPMVFMDREERRNCIYRAWDVLGPEDFLPFHKLLTGAFRMGVSKGNLCKALALVGKLEPAFVAQRLTGDWTPETTSLDKILNPKHTEESLCLPFPFFLACPIQDTAPDELGSVEDWQVEWKWDGIRAQLIKSGGNVMLWSRGEESVGESFPEIIRAANSIPSDVCLDGEILAWGKNGLRPFSRLQKRLGRKDPGPTIMKREPVRFQAYDLLRLKGKDLREQPLRKRRAKLVETLDKLPNEFPIGLSSVLIEKSWGELAALHRQSRERGVEGFMLKRKDSTYQSGRVKGDWFKWKVDPLHADMVMVSAQLGHGKRSNLYSDYSLAVWNDRGELVVVAKAYSGLTDKELKEVDRFVRANITGRFGPVRGVRPKLVFEVAFEGVRFSGRHKSGVALRFPRIKRWRLDKKPSDADTLETVRNLTSSEISRAEDGTRTDEDGNLLLF
jgi:DNA ligase-1